MPSSDSYDNEAILRLRTWKFPEIKFTQNQRALIGARAIQVILARIASAINVEDQNAKAYSPYGPIYIPLTFGAISQRAGGVSAIIQKGRTVASLRGRVSTTRQLYHKYLQAQGYNVKVGGRITAGFKELRSGKFLNYAEFKRYIGHSGDRDLMVTGRMLGDVGIIEETENSVSIGFHNAEQAAKMRGNMKIDNQWGFSPRDKEQIMPVIMDAINENMGRMFFPS